MKLQILPLDAVRCTGWLLIAGVALCAAPGTSSAQGIVPGTGQRVESAFDNFEDPEWEYVPNGEKSSKNVDGMVRGALGKSKNGLWVESSLRGQPDIVRRVETPAGGLPGSNWSMLIQSRDTGIPGRPSYHMQQDDLLIDMASHTGGMISAGSSPNCVVRVYMPPFDQWEQRTGTTFALRLGLRAYQTKKDENSRWGRATTKIEPYWPGIFVYYTKGDGVKTQDSAHFLIRAGRNGGDMRGPAITQTGWWTLGMSVTPDGMVHYYASPGVDDLTSADYITSQYPYGMSALKFNAFFFNVCSADDGRTWSTPWIVDDPAIYTMHGGNYASRPFTGR